MTNVPLHLIKYLQSGHIIAAQMESSAPEQYAFVGVHPFKRGVFNHEPAYESTPWSFAVHRFEIKAEWVELDVGYEDLTDHERQEVDSLEALDTLLGEWVGDPSLFQKSEDNPYYPF